MAAFLGHPPPVHSPGGLGLAQGSRGQGYWQSGSSPSRSRPGWKSPSKKLIQECDVMRRRSYWLRNVEKEEEVVLPNGIRYYELGVDGGASPRPGDLVMIDLKGKIHENSEVFVDTFKGDKKSLALVMGSRPYSKGICEGIEYVLRSMKVGGKRRLIVPPNLGFGEKGTDLGTGVQIPPSASLEYIVEVDKVSIAPA